MDNSDLRNVVFTYFSKKQKMNLAGLIISSLLIFGLVGFYILFHAKFTSMGGFVASVVNFIDMIWIKIGILLSAIKDQVFQTTYLGLFFLTSFGGLFFVTVPIEPLFFKALDSGLVPVLCYLSLMCGAVLSYTIDYTIGFFASSFVRKVVPIKEFYRTKATINKYGPKAIFFFNMIGFGSQQLVTVLGVMRYNRTRLFTLAFLGQTAKWFILWFAYVYATSFKSWLEMIFG